MSKKSFKTSINKTGLKNKGGIHSLISPVVREDKSQINVNKVILETQVTSVTPVIHHQELNRDIRQTFIMGSDYLDNLKNYVHMVRKSGDSMYSQKDALRDALDALFSKVKNIPERPEEVKRREEERKTRIRKGKS